MNELGKLIGEQMVVELVIATICIAFAFSFFGLLIYEIVRSLKKEPQ